jgi:hypothetical protein
MTARGRHLRLPAERRERVSPGEALLTILVLSLVTWLGVIAVAEWWWPA